MDDDMRMKLKRLRLWGLLERWDEYVTLAGKRRCSALRLLTEVIDNEYRVKLDRARSFRLRRAHIPEPYVMATYPFARQRKLDRRKVLSVYDSFEYVEKGNNIVLIGPTGVGKTGLATSYLTQAIERGCKGRFVKFADLVAELYASIADHTQQKVLRQYSKFDCLLIDEVGYVEVEPVQAGLFFTVMQNRHKKHTTIITTNLGFSEWGGFLGNAHLTSALLDRITETSHVFNMRKCVSLRPKMDDKQ